MQDVLNNISSAKIKNLLLKDKKVTSDGVIDFIFIKKIGSVFRQKISVQQILNEVKRQAAAF